MIETSSPATMRQVKRQDCLEQLAAQYVLTLILRVIRPCTLQLKSAKVYELFPDRRTLFCASTRERPE